MRGLVRLPQLPRQSQAETGLRAAASRGLNEPIDSRRIPDCVGRMVTISGTRAAAKEVLTAQGQPMAFLTFEDEFGVFEAVVFPKAYARLMPLIETNAAFLLVGLVQDDAGSLYIEIRDLIGLSRPAPGLRRAELEIPGTTAGLSQPAALGGGGAG